MWTLGLVSAILPEYSQEQVFSFLEEKGFSAVELMCWPKGKAERRYAGVTHLDPEALDESGIARIHDLQASSGVRISGLGYYPNPLDPDEEKSTYYLAHIGKIIRAAARLDVPVVNTFIGRHPAKSVRENIELFKQKWPPLIELAGELGVRIAIENCPMLFTDDEWPGGKNLATSPVIWDELFSIVPSPHFGLNYDPSHLVWQMMDPLLPLRDYADRLHHIHLKDARVYPDKLNRVGIMATPLQFHAPRIPGRGDLNWRAFFAALQSSGYRGPVCIEVEDKDFEGSAADIEKAILAARDHILACMPENDPA
jgi:sugar phosphate isomerase/epimerase